MSAKRRARNRKSISRASRDNRRRENASSLSPSRVSEATSSRRKVKQENDERLSLKSITAWRLWLFRFGAAVVVPVLLLLLAELCLRVIGCGFPAAAIVKCKTGGKDAYCDNVKFGWRFFPRSIAREFVPFTFPAVKANDTYRIFVLGASAVKGEPDSAFCFGRMLQVMLRQQYPGRNFEVIIAAMPAVNSHVVVEIAKDCARHQPDLFIVYLGNNEVTGPYGAGTVFVPLARHLTVIRTSVALNATRLGQMLMQLIERVRVREGKLTEWHGLAMFLKNQVPATDERLRSVYAHFENNLTNIIDVATRNKSKIVLCTVGSNLKDCPPFASLHRPNLGEQERENWEALYQQGVSQERTGNHDDAIRHYLAASEIDSSYADLQFRLGRCYWALAEYQKARERYIQARQLDTLRFRADTRINEIIRASAGNKIEQGVYLVDAVKTFEENSPEGIPGEELFYEHVHMNFKGNYLLAKALCEQVSDVLPHWVKKQQADERPLLTEMQCAEHLAYTDWARYNNAYKILNFYIKEPPFTNQLYHEERVRQMEARLKALEANLTPQVLKDTADLYQQLLEKNPSDVWLRWRYAELLSVHLKDESAAAEQCRLVQELLPRSYRSHLLLALSLERQGRWNEVIENLLRVIQIKPTSAEACYHLALAYQTQAQVDQAIECFFKAARLQPTNVEAHMKLAGLLSEQGQVDRAIRVLRKATHSIPDNPALHFNLGILLDRRNRRNEAVQELRAALQLDPNSTHVRSALESILTRGN